MTNPSKHLINQGFDETMEDMRTELQPAEARLSRLIHQPLLASVGDIVARTLLRPRSLVLGGIFAITALVGAYLIEVFHGYTLSGSESLIGFAVGWLTGTLYEAIKATVQRFQR